MSERPTPRQLAVSVLRDRRSNSYRQGWPGEVADDIFGEIRAKGYAIVHPDDVPIGAQWYAGAAGDKIVNGYWDAKVRGWDECREHVLGERP